MSVAASIAASTAAAQTRMGSATVDKTKMYVSMDQSRAYAEFRPRYTDEMYKCIVDFCKQTNRANSLAVDVGCGPGSSTRGLAKYYQKVIGIDVSETQIACAPTDIPNMEFKVGYSHKLPFIETGSVDLFCSGESFNLMPREETYAEADRVLKPGGTIALFGYNTIRSSDPAVDAAIQKNITKMYPYWPKESLLILDKFRTVVLPYPGAIRNDEMRVAKKISLNEYLGLVRSLWPFVAYSKEHPKEDFGAEIEQDLKAAMKKSTLGSTEQAFEIVYDLFLLMAHKPKN